jgi:serine/threonine protein phosphatase PrpC
VASAAAVDAVASAFEFRAADTAAALASAMRTANDAVLRVAEESAKPNAASTMVAAATRGRHLAVANLGDSRAYLVRDGAARQVTADHAGATPNSITRFLGDPRGVAPDVFVEMLRRQDRLVLCSDGLTRHVSAEEIATLSAGRPDRAAKALVDLANERGGEDNVTVVIYAPTWRRFAPRFGVVLLLALVLVAVIMAAAAMLFSVPAV